MSHLLLFQKQIDEQPSEFAIGAAAVDAVAQSHVVLLVHIVVIFLCKLSFPHLPVDQKLDRLHVQGKGGRADALQPERGQGGDQNVSTGVAQGGAA